MCDLVREVLVITEAGVGWASLTAAAAGEVGVMTEMDGRAVVFTAEDAISFECVNASGRPSTPSPLLAARREDGVVAAAGDAVMEGVAGYASLSRSMHVPDQALLQREGWTRQSVQTSDARG